jgi:hypothetical protein
MPVGHAAATVARISAQDVVSFAQILGEQGN